MVQNQGRMVNSDCCADGALVPSGMFRVAFDAQTLIHPPEASRSRYHAYPGRLHLGYGLWHWDRLRRNSLRRSYHVLLRVTSPTVHVSPAVIVIMLKSGCSNFSATRVNRSLRTATPGTSANSGWLPLSATVPFQATVRERLSASQCSKFVSHFSDMFQCQLRCSPPSASTSNHSGLRPCSRCPSSWPQWLTATRSAGLGMVPRVCVRARVDGES
jgi:hypothetical protein